jgi:hypothetical protein
MDVQGITRIPIITAGNTYLGMSERSVILGPILITSGNLYDE